VESFDDLTDAFEALDGMIQHLHEQGTDPRHSASRSQIEDSARSSDRGSWCIFARGSVIAPESPPRLRREPPGLGLLLGRLIEAHAPAQYARTRG
jgi:hypothetical protein